jgi:hypothetical protein
VEALLEADPKEFSFGTFYVFFLLVFFLSVEVLLETDPNEFDFGNFLSLSKIPIGESQSAQKHKTDFS